MPQAQLESPQHGAPIALVRALEARTRPGVVGLIGELDVATAPHVARLLRESREPVVIIDLRELEFMDVVGLHVILDASTQARRDGRRVVVVRGPAHVDVVFALTATDELIELVALDASESPGCALGRHRARRFARAPARPSLSVVPSAPVDIRASGRGAFMRRVEQELEARYEARLRMHLDVLLPRRQSGHLTTGRQPGLSRRSSSLSTV